MSKIEPSGEGMLWVYDLKKQCWRYKNIHEIPTTYSFVPLPQTALEECRLWLKAVHRIKHKFIWSKDAIPMDEFEKVASVSNRENLDRFSYVKINPQRFK